MAESLENRGKLRMLIDKFQFEELLGKIRFNKPMSKYVFYLEL